MTIQRQDAEIVTSRNRSWMRRAGRIGFAFFFIKGMAWLALPLALWLIE